MEKRLHRNDYTAAETDWEPGKTLLPMAAEKTLLSIAVEKTLLSMAEEKTGGRGEGGGDRILSMVKYQTDSPWKTKCG